MKKNIKRSWFSIIILSFSFQFLVLSFSYSITVSDVLKNVQQKEKETESMVAVLVETITSKTSNAKQTFEGSITLKKPDKIYVEFKKPMNQKIISNGKVMWVYMQDLKQVMQQEMSLGGVNDPILSIGKMLETLQKDYNVVLQGTENVEGEETYVLDLTPKKENKYLSKMKTYISKQTWLPIKTNVMDMEGSDISVVFKNIKLNVKIDNKIFEFKPPKDVEIMKNPLQIAPK
jgi:outer membrane lipoprotein carrier protein